MAAQSESVDSAKESSYDSSFERRLAQILPHAGQNAPAAKPAQSLPARSDRASRTFPGQAHQAPGQDLARPLGASVAAERYVFGRMDLATDPTPLAVAIGAFQTGGPPSIVSANWGEETISVLVANPDGTFQPAVDYAVGEGPEAIAVGDFNGDGNLDLAVANWYGATVSILLGNGDGTFQPQVTYSCVSACGDVIVGDFNGDGKLDLAVSAFDANEVGILLGNGDGTFQAAITSAAGDGPYYLVAEDFNGDGNLDLAALETPFPFCLARGMARFNPKSNTSPGTVRRSSSPAISAAITNST
jgi:hypothetical protein